MVNVSTSAYGAAGQTLSYNYAVTNTGPDTLTNITVNDNKIASANINCPSSSLAGNGGTETCTGSYTTTQADVDAGSVTNTATVSGTTPSSQVVTSAWSSPATVYASNATSSLSLESSLTPAYGAAGDGISYNYLLQHRHDHHLEHQCLLDSLIASVSCPGSSLSPGSRRPARAATR